MTYINSYVCSVFILNERGGCCPQIFYLENPYKNNKVNTHTKMFMVTYIFYQQVIVILTFTSKQDLTFVVVKKNKCL